MELFNIIRTSPHRHVSLKLPAADAKRGIAFQDKGGADTGTAELADGLKPLAGFVTREVKATGPTLQDKVFEDYLQPFQGGHDGSFEKLEVFEVEGADYIDSSITAATALETDLSFTAGKIGTHSGSQIKLFRLKQVITDPAKLYDPVNNTFRIRVEAITA